jgi:hypothetical protein
VGFFPLSAGFGLGEVEDGETLVSKISLPLPEFPVARLAKETDDRFRVRVELATVNVVGRYARGQHDTCIVEVSNMGRLKHVLSKLECPMALAWYLALRLLMTKFIKAGQTGLSGLPNWGIRFWHFQNRIKE